MNPMTELDDKTERLTRLAKEQKLGGILLLSQPGFSWITCGRTNRIDGSRENGSGAVFVRADGRRYVIANAIEMPRLTGEELAGAGWDPIEYPWTDDHAHPDTLVRLAHEAAGARGPIGSDTALGGATLIDQALSRARAPLTSAEVDRYRALGRDAGVCIGELCRSLRPGTTELAVARQVSDAAAAIGGRAIVVLVAADDRVARFRHPVPTTRTWTHTLLVVACIQRAGLVVALSRIVSAQPSPELLARTSATARVFDRLLDATRPGTRAAGLFATACAAYEEVGFAGEERRHHQGGAIGYRSRDWVAHPASEEVVQRVQAFAWNPSITGTKVEDTALLTEDGIDIITASPGWPLVDERAAGILTL